MLNAYVVTPVRATERQALLLFQNAERRKRRRGSSMGIKTREEILCFEAEKPEEHE
jgi:hypothetical protein